MVSDGQGSCDTALVSGIYLVTEDHTCCAALCATLLAATSLDRPGCLGRTRLSQLQAAGSSQRYSCLSVLWGSVTQPPGQQASGPSPCSFSPLVPELIGAQAYAGKCPNKGKQTWSAAPLSVPHHILEQWSCPCVLGVGKTLGSCCWCTPACFPNFLCS